MSKPEKTDKEPTGDSFDLDRLRELIQMMEDHGVTEINLRNESEQWRLRRGQAVVPAPMAPVAPIAPAAPVAPAAPAAPQAETPADPSTEGLIEIKSPTVGTYYSKPTPDDPEFVKVGSQVSNDTVVCLVEAMKVFNEIKAECSGVIEKILVSEGDAVDFGQPIFLVRP